MTRRRRRLKAELNAEVEAATEDGFRGRTSRPEYIPESLWANTLVGRAEALGREYGYVLRTMLVRMLDRLRARTG